MKEKVFKSRNKNLNVFVITFFVILLVYSVSLFIPLIWGFYTSFKHWVEFRTNVVGLPDLSLWETYAKLDPDYNHVLANYGVLIKNFEFKRAVSYYVGIFNERPVRHEVVASIFGCLVNTALYCAGCCILPTFMSLIYGYLCAKYRYKFATFFYTFQIFTIFKCRITNLRYWFIV